MLSKLLPENAVQLLRDLNGEFYSQGLAHADAFRILPLIADYLESEQSNDQSLLEVCEDLLVYVRTLNSEDFNIERLNQSISKAQEAIKRAKGDHEVS